MKIKYTFLIFSIAIAFISCSKEELPKKRILSPRKETLGIHKKIDKLLLEYKINEAESIAKEAYNKYPREPEVICALACVYKNEALQSRIYKDSLQAGEKIGQSGAFILKGKKQEDILKEYYNYVKERSLKAESLYYKIIEIDSTYLQAYLNLLGDYLNTLDFEGYFKVVDLLIKNLRNDKMIPDYLIYLGDELIKNGHYEEAIRLLKVTLNSYPKFTKAESKIGLVYFLMGKIPEAKEVSKKIYLKDKNDLANLKNYISCAVLEENFKLAYDLYIELIGKDKEDYGNYFEAGLLAYLLGKDYKRLLTKYKEARKKEVEAPEKDFWYQVSSEFLEIDTKEEEEKLTFLDFLLENFFSSDLSRLSIITANIIEEFELTNHALTVKFAIFNKHNYFEKVIEYLDKIKERREFDPTIMSDYVLNLSYGRINYIAGNYEKAKEYLLKNFSLGREDPFINHFLGLCYLKLNEKEEAKKYFKINAKLTPKDNSQMRYVNYSRRILRELEDQ